MTATAMVVVFSPLPLQYCAACSTCTYRNMPASAEQHCCYCCLQALLLLVLRLLLMRLLLMRPLWLLHLLLLR